MRDYGVLAPTFWTGETGRALREAGADAQLVAVYLVTGPSANMIGIYHMPVAMIACHIKLTVQGASKALQRVCETGFAEYDENSETVFVPRMAEFQIGQTLKPGDNRIKAIVKQLELIRKSKYAKDFHAIYKTAYHLPSISPFEGPSKGVTKPLRSQEQDQDQEQDQEQDQKQDQDQDPSLKGSQSADADSLNASAPSLPEQVAAVYAKYLEHHPKAAKLLNAKSKEFTLIKNRLAEGFTVEALRDAIDGNHISTWHCGQNPEGRQYHALTLIFRDQSKVTNFIEFANGKREASDPRGNFAAADEYLSMFPPESPPEIAE